MIIRLNDQIDRYAPNFEKVLADHPDWHKQVITDEGDLYVSPFLRSDPVLLTFIGPVIRADWLDKLGLKVPTTLDDWHTMLTAFKQQNANGQGTTLPFSPWFFSIPGGWNAWHGAGAFLEHAFIGAWGITMGFHQVNGKVAYGALQPEFQDFAKTMRQWFSEGLIDPDFPSTDQAGFDAKVTGGRLGSFVGLGGNGIGKYLGLVKEPGFKLLGAPYPVLKAGDKQTVESCELRPWPTTPNVTGRTEARLDCWTWHRRRLGRRGRDLARARPEGTSPCGDARNTGRPSEVSWFQLGMTETRPAEAWNNVNSDVVRQFRSDNGKISSGMFKGARLLLLTTTGAKSGKERINPLAFTRDGDNYVIIASKGGSPTHPDWYYNILANPEVRLEVASQSGVDQFRAHARIAEGDERQRLYNAQARVMPNFAEYQKKTAREIPVIVLQPRRQK